MTLLSLLSPRARALVEAGRGAERPTAADRERIQSALKSRLGAGAFEPSSSGASPAPGAAANRPLVSGILAGVAAVGGVVVFALSAPSEPARAPERHPPAITAREVVAEASAAPAEVVTPAVPSTVVAQVPSAPPAPSPRSKQDRLAQEVALLSSATKSLSAGRPGDALKILDEHQRRFPGGLLAEERRAARAQALCGLGRVAEAQAELARLAPRSPAEARALKACERARP